MRLAQLRSFYAAARYGGFTAGARQLHVSQPTVTSQVRALELSYGVELFHRRGHRLELSDVGRELFAIAQRIFGLEEDAVHLLKDSGALRTGNLRIGAVGPYHVMEMIAAFRAPLSADRGDDQRRQFRGDGEEPQGLRVRRRRARAVRARSRCCISCRTGRIRWWCSWRAGIASTRRASVALAELADEPLVMREKGSTTRKALEDALRRLGLAPKISLEVGSREAVREAVIRGLGIAVVSEFEFVPDPRLAVLAIAGADVRTTTHVVTLQERRHARVVAGFLAIVDELLVGAAMPRAASG